jgi:hypothetical protein
MAVSRSSPADTAQLAAIEGAGRTQHALTEAQDHLLRVLRRPQPTRERRWAAAVGTELAAAVAALRQHRLEVEYPEGLYAELVRDAPWVAPRVRQVAAQLRRVESEACDLQTEVARVESGDLENIASIRSDAERMLQTLRDLMSKEADLIWERFNEPSAVD